MSNVPTIEVIKAGPDDRIQDMGRFGYQHLGIPPSGVMDAHAASVANILLNNSVSLPVIELVLSFAKWRILCRTYISTAGAEVEIKLNGKIQQVGQVFGVEKDDELQFSPSSRGARLYVAVQGGWRSEVWLGSASTDIWFNRGGHQGRRLQSGDLLMAQASFNLPEIFKRQFYRCDYLPKHEVITTIRMIPAPEFELWSKQSNYTQNNISGKVTTQSNRMGYHVQLQRPIAHQHEMQSSPITVGAIEWLPNGNWIVLMSDHPTTGGYPWIGTVITADLPRLAQITPGSIVEWEWVDIDKAVQLLLEQRRNLQILQHAIHESFR